jgi:Ca2+-transporting ATPase
MNRAVLLSLVLLLAVVYIPFLNPVFQTYPLDLKAWSLIVPLFFIPAITAEIAKVFIYRKPKK